jgi:lipopolysaccharide export LptBFGC system permease protein LptF
MIAMLATYVIKSRQNEIVTWTASGQSVYRLLFPCFILMMMIGFFNWVIQEKLLPQTNQNQDALRVQLRNNGILTATAGKYWVANENRIYSFELGENAQNDTIIRSQQRHVRNLTIYQFSQLETKLQSIIKTEKAIWEAGKIKLLGEIEKTVWNNELPQMGTFDSAEREVLESYNPFNQTTLKPSHLSAKEIEEQIKTVESESEKRKLNVAFQKRYTTLFLPLVIAFFTAPFALSLSRRGKVTTIGYAVGLWLLYMGITNAFDQFGTIGFVEPEIAVWSPLILFMIIGAYLLTKVKT